MANPTLVSADGRSSRQVTSKEELDQLKEEGWTVPSKAGARDTLDSGAEGNRRARASSTTEGSERNTGSTTPSR